MFGNRNKLIIFFKLLFSQVQYHKEGRSFSIDSLDIKMKNDQKFSDLVSGDCSGEYVF